MMVLTASYNPLQTVLKVESTGWVERRCLCNGGSPSRRQGWQGTAPRHQRQPYSLASGTPLAQEKIKTQNVVSTERVSPSHHQTVGGS